MPRRSPPSSGQSRLQSAVVVVPPQHTHTRTCTRYSPRPDNKVTLWENLKIVSFARLVAGVYACSLLVVFLRVQLSVLGGCMFLDLQKVRDPCIPPLPLLVYVMRLLYTSSACVCDSPTVLTVRRATLSPS